MDGSSLLQALWNWILMRPWTSTLGRHRPGALSGIRLANSWRLAGSRSIEGVIDVARAEAQALWDGLCLAERIGCTTSISSQTLWRWSRWWGSLMGTELWAWLFWTSVELSWWDMRRHGCLIAHGRQTKLQM
jgi:hypothetical protein